MSTGWLQLYQIVLSALPWLPFLLTVQLLPPVVNYDIRFDFVQYFDKPVPLPSKKSQKQTGLEDYSLDNL